MATLRLNNLFGIIANEMPGNRKSQAYRVVRDVLRIRRDLGIRNDVADLLHKRHLLLPALADDHPNLLEDLRSIFELDTVWDYLVSKDAVDPTNDSAYVNDDDDDDDEEDDNDSSVSDEEDEDTIDSEDEADCDDLASDIAEVHIHKNVNHYHGPDVFMTLVAVLNTFLSATILTKLLM